MKRGRRKSTKYLTWLRVSESELLPQKVDKIKGSYQLELHVGKTTTRADIDNLIKPISDLLVKMGITEDDAKMMRCSAEFVTYRKNVLIMIKEFE